MLSALFVSLQIFLLSIGIYQLLLTCFAWYRKKPGVLRDPEKSFAILIPAHNEEQVLGALLDNLKNLNYPSKLYDLFVICDNCTDRTVDIAHKHQVFAYERCNLEERGKGYAIEWMLNQLRKLPRKYDAVVMFDADNLVSADFLLHMNDELCSGSKVIQGYLDTKNPLDSWISAGFAVSYWNVNRLTQLPRQNLGLACFLNGTGMCFDSELLQEMGWGATSLVEDMEFTMRCVERGVYPRFNYEARVFDEKPVTFKASVRQRLRWMQGHFYVARQFFFPLLWRGIKEANWAKIDTAIYSMNVYTIFIGSLLTIALWIDQVLPGEARITSLYNYASGWSAYLPLSLLIYLILILSLVAERVPIRVYATLLTFPIFTLSWSPIVLYAFFTQNNKQWSHTEHTRVLRLEDMRSG